ncbi:hypothetical protein ACFL5B_00260 [Candidatus Latescibacterota bacterium]
MNVIHFIAMVLLLIIPEWAVFAQESTNTSADPQTKQTKLENKAASTITEYEKRISELESRIKEIEEDRAKEEGASELEKLLQEAQDLKGIKQTQEPTIRVFSGTERHQPQLNPEISLTGDFFFNYSSSDAPYIAEPGDYTDGRNQFYLRDLGFHFVSPLDPFTRGKFFLGLPGSGDNPLSDMIDEAYMEWLNLPLGLNLKIGQYFNQFGILNRYHDHGLPQVDRPSVLTRLFGNGNLSGFGLSGNFLLPSLWAHVNELNVEIATSGDGFSYDDSYNNVFSVVHLKNYYDLTQNTYFEFGLSGAHGYNDKDNEYISTLAALDFTYKWVPAGRSHYRTTEISGEFIFSHREVAGNDLDRYGFYTYIKNRMGARSLVALRYGYTQHPFDVDEKSEWDITPMLEVWQSEFVKLRLEYSYTERSYGDNDHTIFVHTVWSMGPHKHEAY